MESNKLTEMLTTRRSNWSASSLNKILNTNSRSSPQYNSSLLMLEHSNRPGKIPCCFHPGEKITNFCKTKQCLLPLCPKCIMLHSQQHQNMGVFGSFCTIQDVIEEASIFLQTSSIQLDTLLKKIADRKQIFEDQLLFQKNRINDARQLIHEQIDQVFDNCLEEWFGKMKQLNKQQIDIIERCQKLASQLRDDLEGMKRKMNSNCGLIEGTIAYFTCSIEWKKMQLLADQFKNSNLKLINLPLSSQQYLGVFSSIKQYLKLGQQRTYIDATFPKINRSTQHLLTFSQASSNLFTQSPRPKINQQQIIEPGKNISDDDRKIKLRFDYFVSPLQSFSLEEFRMDKRS